MSKSEQKVKWCPIFYGLIITWKENRSINNLLRNYNQHTYGIAENVLCPYCRQNDSIIHTFCNCHWTKWFFSEVIKWFNVENATSFAPSSSELIFGLNNDIKNQSSLPIVKKLDFTLLFAKYYLYINKLAPKDLSLDEFKAKISWWYDFEKPPPSTS